MLQSTYLSQTFNHVQCVLWHFAVDLLDILGAQHDTLYIQGLYLEHAIAVLYMNG
jgi:hypothetical protein